MYSSDEDSLKKLIQAWNQRVEKPNIKADSAGSLTVCWYCNKPGHKSEDCPIMEKNKDLFGKSME